MNVDFPLHFDGRGRTATTGDADHVRDLIEQLLFTAPGERLNRPDFGTGLLALVFEPNSQELAAATRFATQGALQRWLGDRVAVDDVQAVAEESSLRVTVAYRVLQTGEDRVDSFEREVG
jgi:phage baseplate assembly protein W